MKTRILNFFEDSGKLILSPEELFYLKGQKAGAGGIASLIFYSAFTSLIIGILMQSLTFAVILMVITIVVGLVVRFVHAIFIHIFSSLIFNGQGNLMACFNLICYPSVLDIFLIIGLVGTVLNKMFIFPLLMLVVIWRFVIVITAVATEYGIDFGKAFFSTYGIWLIIVTILMGIL